MNHNIIDITEDSFYETVLNSAIPVLVEFGAPWCGPCSRQFDILSTYETTNHNLVKICRLNIDDCVELTKKYQIRSVPTIILFRNGLPIKTVVGLQSKQNLDNLLSM